MSTHAIFHWSAVFGASCVLSFYVAQRYPAIYLRCQDAITWATHALSLGVMFGIGVIVGRYGFLEDTTRLIGVWLMIYAPLVTVTYIATLLYHRFLCTIAANCRSHREIRIRRNVI